MRRVILGVLVVASGIALAQQAARPAVEKFHEAARLFVAGDTTAAAREARAGLAIDPRDPSLRALLAEIERRPPPQPSGAGGNDQRPPSREEPEERNQGQGRSERPEPEPQERSQNSGDEEEREQAPARPGADRQGGIPEGEAQAPQPGRMTREEAEALLRALGADERRLLRARRQSGDDRQFENDW